jgi:hypothetical protein
MNLEKRTKIPEEDLIVDHQRSTIEIESEKPSLHRERERERERERG